MGSLIGHRTDYNGAGVLRGLYIIEEIRKAVEMMAMNLEDRSKGLIQDELLS